MRIAAFSLNSSRTAFAKRKQEAQVERLTTQFKHANAILITNAVWWRGAQRAKITEKVHKPQSKYEASQTVYRCKNAACF